MSMNQNYLLIDTSTNVCDNVCVWDGNPDTWTPPASHICLLQATTPATVWVWDVEAKDWVLGEELGAGAIGFIWNGTALVTNEPKPPIPVPGPDGPTVAGAQTL